MTPDRLSASLRLAGVEGGAPPTHTLGMSKQRLRKLSRRMARYVRQGRKIAHVIPVPYNEMLWG
jgi:hypothetical protein